MSPLSILRKQLSPQGFSHSRHRSLVVFVALGGACLGHEISVRSIISLVYQTGTYARTIVHRAIEINTVEAWAEICVQAVQSPA
jgi:hypothetical protein